MIISNYSSIMLRTSSAESASAAKTVTPDKTSTHSSASLSSQATADPAQGLDKHSAQAASISQTSVSATEASTHQSSDKQRQENDALISKDLAQRDREVKNHERIHASIGGSFASAPHFSYQKGPDGQLYAVEGDVRIDTSAVAGDPRATLEKAQVIIRAALSVPEPSVQDKRVAAQARAMATEASAEIAKRENPLEDRFGDGSEKVIAQASSTAPDETSESQHRADINVDKPSKEDQADKESKDKKSVADSNAEMLSSSQDTAASLQEFNKRLNDINKTLHDINLRLVEAGVFEKLFPEGSIIDKNV